LLKKNLIEHIFFLAKEKRCGKSSLRHGSAQLPVQKRVELPKTRSTSCHRSEVRVELLNIFPPKKPTGDLA